MFCVSGTTGTASFAAATMRSIRPVTPGTITGLSSGFLKSKAEVRSPVTARRQGVPG